MKYMGDATETLPLHLRQALADENSSPQRDVGSLTAEIDRFIAKEKEYDKWREMIHKQSEDIFASSITTMKGR